MNRYTFALAGNPNVGKSSVFNAITGLNQHTGNWSGKTVEVCNGNFVYNGIVHNIIDLPGSYSMYAESEEEFVTKEYIEKGCYDVIILVADANALERNLGFCLQVLSKTSKAVMCLNMVDIVDKKGIYIDTDELSLQLGIPVVKSTANKKRGSDQLVKTALGVAFGEIKTYRIKQIADINNAENKISAIEMNSQLCAEICRNCVKQEDKHSDIRTNRLDKLFTSKLTGIPIMILLFAILFWITAYGANYPSEILSLGFSYVINGIETLMCDLNISSTLTSFICDGVLTTAAWVISVMLPPATIFFPVFSLLEDWGYLPRVAFNLDGAFCKAGVGGKQALTMMMGFGCNACGVVGCRIISNKHERNIGILTNNFVPCNGRLPTLIALSTIFIAPFISIVYDSVVTTFVLIIIIMLSVIVTLGVSKILSIIFKTNSADFTLELPSYKKPQFIKTIILSLKNKVLHILLRAVVVALPAGAVIWLLTNVAVGEKTILQMFCDILEPFAKIIGVDGTIVASFILGFPANEIVLPIMLMSYTSGSTLTEYSSLSSLCQLLLQNGWTPATAICTMILCVFHFPCSTTCITIYKETKSILITILSVIIPIIIGIVLCMLINGIAMIL